MEQLIQDLKDYIDLRTKRFKLRMVEELAVLSSRMFVMIIVLLTTLLALFAFAVAGGILIYNLLGSAFWAAVLVGLFFILWALIFLLMRKKLFTGGMVRTFSKMFFTDHGYKSKDEYGDE